MTEISTDTQPHHPMKLILKWLTPHMYNKSPPPLCTKSQNWTTCWLTPGSPIQLSL